MLGGGPPPPPPPPPLASINANGWTGEWADGSPPAFDPDVAPVTFAVTRAGFDATGAAVSHTDALVVTKRVRQPYPNQAALTPATVSLSDYVYSSDTIAGAINNSAEASPKPVAQWGQSDRRVVGNTIAGEIVAFQRDGRGQKPVACVVVTATDGTNTVTQTVSACTKSMSIGDQQPVLVYAYALDISALADNAMITVNAKVYPWLGTAASVLDSATGVADNPGFVPQLFFKRLARASAPFYAYVAAGGSDATGAISTDPAVAAAAPCASIGGATQRLRAVIGSADLDGCVIRLTAGTWPFGSNAFNTYQTNAELIIEAAPGVAQAAAIVTYGAGDGHYTKWYRLRNLTLRRTANVNFYIDVNNGKLALENVAYDNGGFAAKLLSRGRLYVEGGLAVTSPAAGAFQAAAGWTVALFRGVSWAAGGMVPVEGFNVLGCNLPNVSFNWLTTRMSGSIVAFNKALKATAEIFSPAGADVVGMAFVQNVGEWTLVTANPAFGPSRDSATGNITHLIVWHNTLAGANNGGRSNVLYDDGPNGNLRVHKLQSFVGNIHVQINTKNDWFAGANLGLPDASAHTGNWAYTHGVGCRGEFSQFRDAGNGDPKFRQDYPGLNASIGTSNTIRNDPKFVSYAAVTYNGATYTAGAGGGDYALQANSPCKGKVPSSPLPFDLAGNPRSAVLASQGAYE